MRSIAIANKTRNQKYSLNFKLDMFMYEIKNYNIEIQNFEIYYMIYCPLRNQL